MSKIAHYLQEHLVGEVMTSQDARNYFAKDSSIFNIVPALIVYPRNENDIRKTTRFSWQLAERNRLLPITSRGSGTDTTGAALGSGLVIVFPAHLHHILELDNKSGEVTVKLALILANFSKLFKHMVDIYRLIHIQLNTPRLEERLLIISVETDLINMDQSPITLRDSGLF